MPILLHDKVHELARDEVEKMRRVLTEALAAQAERYSTQGRHLMAVNDRKPGQGFDTAARELFDLAAYAVRLRAEIKEG